MKHPRSASRSSSGFLARFPGEQSQRGRAFADEDRDAVPHSFVTVLETENVDIPLRRPLQVAHGQRDMINAFELNHRVSFASFARRARSHTDLSLNGMKSPRLFAFLVLLGGLLPTAKLVDLTPSEPTIGSWPSFGNGPSHTGFYPITIGDVTVVPGWTKTFPDHPLNYVAISGGRVYATATGFNAGDNNSNVPFAVALDSVTGNELWRRTLSGFPAPPAVSGESVVVQLAHSNDAMYVLRANDGSVQWSRVFNSEWRFDAATVLGDRIWANSSYGLLSFRISDNSQRFIAALDDPYGCTNSYSAGVVYIAERNFFRALDAETGARLWSVPNYSQNTENAVPAVLNGTAFVSDSNSSLTAMDLVTKSVRWRVFGNFNGRPATDGSSVYVLEGVGINSCAAETGQLRGRYNPAFIFSEYPSRGSQPLVTNDLVMIGSNRAT